MWDSSHTHTHHTINQIGVSQSPPLKSLMFSVEPTLWGSASEFTRDYWTGSNTIYVTTQGKALVTFALVTFVLYIPDVRLVRYPHTSHNQSNWGITVSLT